MSPNLTLYIIQVEAIEIDTRIFPIFIWSNKECPLQLVYKCQITSFEILTYGNKQKQTSQNQDHFKSTVSPSCPFRVGKWNSHFQILLNVTLNIWPILCNVTLQKLKLYNIWLWVTTWSQILPFSIFLFPPHHVTLFTSFLYYSM